MPRDGCSIRNRWTCRGSQWQQGPAITRQMSLVAFASQDPPQSISDIGVIVESEDRISLRHGRCQLVTVALCQTTDGHDGLGAPGLREVTGGKQRVNRVFLGSLDEAAGVDHHCVRVTRVGRHCETIVLQQGSNFLRVDLIARTSECDEVHCRRWRGHFWTLAGCRTAGSAEKCMAVPV